ncbi:MAG: 5-formyltetrahydrofolate cyclo-ligase [Peptococcaceae bacterium]|nr:5-formyltetrahydrofolate cyclo-ligase [Peptococcaceae bacterium]
MVQSKTEIRKQILSIRGSIDQVQKEVLNQKIIRQILSLPYYCTAGTVMVYLNAPDEVQTTEIAQHILQSGKRLIVPYCGTGEIVPHEIFDLQNDIAIGKFGIREPRADHRKPISSKDIDFILVPGVAFDREGNRIGFGKGYYDRFLPMLRSDVCIAGLAYSFQIVERIAVQEHDYKMSLLITENGVIYPG